MLALEQKVKFPRQETFTMLKLRGPLSLAAGLILAAIGLAAPAEANPVTYVSGKGSDSNNCFSPATPCRTFQRAVNQTAAGGEVKALDPADYQPVTITKSITITGVQGAGIDTSGGTAVTVGRTAPGPSVHLDHLIINNVAGSGGGGIDGGPIGTSWDITHCTIQGYATGLAFAFATFVVADSVIKDNGTGIFMVHASGTLDHVRVYSNTTGVLDSEAFLLIGGSSIEGNGTGIAIEGGGATSFGDNHIKGTDVKFGT
jgi:hypothetical protein